MPRRDSGLGRKQGPVEEALSPRLRGIVGAIRLRWARFPRRWQRSDDARWRQVAGERLRQIELLGRDRDRLSAHVDEAHERRERLVRARSRDDREIARVELDEGSGRERAQRIEKETQPWLEPFRLREIEEDLERFRGRQASFVG